MNHLNQIAKTLASLTLLAAVAGKLINPDLAALDIADMFSMPARSAIPLLLALLAVELGVAIAIWWRPRRWLLALPAAFLLVTAISHVRNRDCLCFGELPFFSTFPLWAHLMLIAALATAIWVASEQSRSAVIPAMAIAGFLLAFATQIGPAPSVRGDVSVAALQSISLEQLLPVLGGTSHQIVDARSPELYRNGHLPGAVNVPYDLENLDKTIAEFELGSQPVIIYCSGPDCGAADQLASRFQQAGIDKILIFEGGWQVWSQYDQRQKQKD